MIINLKPIQAPGTSNGRNSNSDERKPSVLFDDTENADESFKRQNPIDLSKQMLLQSKRARTETYLARKKALDEDASVYSFDEIYDELHPKAAKQNEAKRKGIVDRTPKYINSLKNTAIERQKMLDAAFDKRIRRETEKEKKEFGEKEAFTTRAYLHQLEEDKKWEQQTTDEGEDVTKKDVGSFKLNMLMMSEKEPNEMSEMSEKEPKVMMETSDGFRVVLENDEQLNTNTVQPMRDTKRASAEEYMKRIKEQERDERRKKEREERELLEEARRRQEAKQKKFLEEYQKAQEAKSKQEQEEKNKMVEKFKSKVTEDKIVDAKERYLQRKRMLNTTQQDPIPPF